MASALARTAPISSGTADVHAAAARGVPLRVARPAEDLEQVLEDALSPHRVAATRDVQDANRPLAPVIPLRPRSDTPRGQVRATAILAVGALVLAIALAALSGTAADTPVPADVVAPVTVPADQVVVIQPGQTLWDVARDVTPPGGDVRATVADLRAHNGFTSTDLPAWTPVAIPAD
jgi:LysM repeat protein